MRTSTPLDCVIVGYKDVEFSDFVNQQKAMEEVSGAYMEIKCNSVLLDGRRQSYPELLNRSLYQATGVDRTLNGFEAPALGAYHLASFLLQKGLAVEIVNFFNQEKDRFDELLESRPRAVAITTTYYVDHAPIVDMVRYVRDRCPETRIVVGGPHIFNICSDHDPKTQEMILDLIGADVYVFDSQGELTLARLLKQMRRSRSGDFSAIPNLVYPLGGGGYRRTARVAEDNQMDAIGVDWNLFNSDYFSPVVFLRTARSCPFSCSFCSYPTLAGDHVTSGIEALEKNMRDLKESGVSHICFVDDTFNVPLPRFKSIMRMMIRNQFDFRWVSFFRCSNSDEEAFDLMAEAGCLGTLLGVESGDQRILTNMNKAVKIERYYNGVRELKKRGILTYSMLISGYPGETEESINNTLEFVRETKPDFYNYQLYFHNQKSPIQRRAEEFGIRGAGYSWSHNTMDWREASRWMENFYRSINPDDSIVLPLYGVSMWTVPYLLAKGITMDQFKEFTRTANRMLIQCLDDRPVDLSREEQQLASVFAGWQWLQTPPAGDRVLGAPEAAPPPSGLSPLPIVS
jgi:radical SAM PhpK family P-methyltransferase